MGCFDSLYPLLFGHRHVAFLFFVGVLFVLYLSGIPRHIGWYQKRLPRRFQRLIWGGIRRFDASKGLYRVVSETFS